MVGFIDRLLGRSGRPTGLDPDDQADIEAFLDGFARVGTLVPGIDAGLAVRLKAYVFFGEGEEVISAIWEKVGNSVQWGGPQGIESVRLQPLASFLICPKQWNPAVVFRIAQVLDATFKHNLWYSAKYGGPSTPSWLKSYLMSVNSAYGHFEGHKAGPDWQSTISSERLFDLCRIAETDDRILLNAALNVTDDYDFRHGGNHLLDVPDLPAFVAARPDLVAELLPTFGALARTTTITFLGKHDLVCDRFLDLVYDALLDGSKAVRAAAFASLDRADRARLSERVAAAFAEGGPKDRTAAVEVVAQFLKPEALERLARQAAVEKSKPVLAAIESALRRLAAGSTVSATSAADLDANGGRYIGVGGVTVLIPPQTTNPPESPVGGAGRSAMAAFIAEWNQQARQHNEAVPVPPWKRPIYSEGMANGVVDLMEGRGSSSGLVLPQALWHPQTPEQRGRLQAVYRSDDFTFAHLARAGLARSMHPDYVVLRLLVRDTPLTDVLAEKLKPPLDIRNMLEVVGRSREHLAYFMMSDAHRLDEVGDLEAEFVWPYLAENLPIFEQALGLAPNRHTTTLSVDRALDLLTQLPLLPERFLSRVVDLGVGERATTRAAARRLLADFADADRLLPPLLQSPKAEIRARAAEWLAERHSGAAIDAIEAALKKEKSELGRAALLTALRRLGGDLGRFTSAEALAKEAAAGLAKARSLPEWIRLDVMPPLAWRNGMPVDPVIPRWWIALAIKLRQPGGNALFDLYLDDLRPGSAEALGLFLLKSFIDYDTRRPSDEEASAYADAEVDRQLAQYVQWLPEMTREQLYSQLKQGKLWQYFGSAIDEKGILGLTSRVSGGKLVQVVKAYLKDHYPRTAQCKALMESVAANPSPVALQYLLVISNRYRTRSVQQLAAALIDRLSAERGWTRDELGDRTTPTGGLDENGILDLPIGGRAYSARLDAELKLALFNTEGRPVQGLPSTSDDTESLAAAKKLLAQARKEVRQVVELQSARLYEAFCCDRRWSVEDWTSFVLGHPIVGRLAQRLVWQGWDTAGRAVASFRPLDDLTLTDTVDTPVEASGFAEIGLAHPLSMSGQAADWAAHFADYAVKPLFAQFDRPVLRPDAESATATAIADREGCIVEAFKLRSEATKRGYQRGETGDGGWFTHYVKHFESLKLAAVVEFSGNGLPEENRPTALIRLEFVQKGREGRLRHDQPLKLGSVPAALLSEAWNDYHAMAAAGPGHDPAWQTKVGW